MADTQGISRALHPERSQPDHRARDLPYPANTVFNPAAAIVDGETLLLLRVEDRAAIRT